MRINDPKGGFQYNTRYIDQGLSPGLVFIEGGTFTMGDVSDDVMHEWNSIPREMHIQSFYMDETEVTNLMYLEYLDWLKRVFNPDNPNYRHIYEGALPDTLVWRSPLSFNEDLVVNYLRHPAYSEYPVVGVNWVQAVQYANWRTDRVNEMQLIKHRKLKKEVIYNENPEEGFNTETYLAAPEMAFGGNTEYYPKRSRKDSTLNVANISSGIIIPKYRLPTELEWEYAAKSVNGERIYNRLKNRKIYPWRGNATRYLGRGRNRGKQMANFKQGDGDYSGLAGWSDDAADITAPVGTYPPNDFGLYDMAGNVNEWVADVYRPIIDDEASDFNYFRGNIYTKLAFNEEGKLVVITTDSIPYDTLATGKIIYKELPGAPAKKLIDEKELYLRQNFYRADNRDYRDGDLQSSRYYNLTPEDLAAEGDDKKRVYNSPIHKIYMDSVDGKWKMVREYDKSSSRTTLIDNEVRVYKGGSWKDRAYWLQPSKRRFLPQYLSTNDIGFRCAMSRFGRKTIKKTYRRPAN
jgi:gliding motility-associated lipoprotein GldJ